MAETAYDFEQVDVQALKIETNYCVTQSVHQAQVRASLARHLPQIQASQATSYELLAVVGSGPSLINTWPEIKKFRHIMSASGAHDFLLERGIVPTWHIETDPRPHKAEFHHHPHRDVDYLIASNCHPKVFDALDGFTVHVWHVLGADEPRMLPHLYPRGGWLLSGGSNAGLRALVMGRVLGFTNMHIFGMDCSMGTSFHANAHPLEPKAKKHQVVRVGGRSFTTTNIYLEYARQFFHETAMLPDVQMTLHGDGLLQALVTQKLSDPAFVQKRHADLWGKQGEAVTIAIQLPEVISPDYQALLTAYHETDPDYGTSGSLYAVTVRALADSLAKERQAVSVLDYGCGKGRLADILDLPIWEYDPAIPAKRQAPRPADLVVCTHVLECVEPTFLDQVLADLARCTKQVLYLIIKSQAAQRLLPDGRNVNLIQEGTEWWREQLAKYFIVAENSIMVRANDVLHIVVSPKAIAVPTLKPLALKTQDIPALQVEAA